MWKRIVAVGSDEVGKTSLLVVFKDGLCPLVHTPRSWFGYTVPVEVKHELFQLILWDIEPVDNSEEHLRVQGYTYADAFLICFSVDNPSSFTDVEEKWIVELRQVVGDLVPIYLIGCKKDLRADPHTLAQLASRSQSIMTASQGEQMATKIGAAAYLECSSKTGEGVRELFLHVLEDTHYRAVKMRWSRGKAIKEGRCVVM